MLNFFAKTKNNKKNQNNRVTIAGKLSDKNSGKLLFAISIIDNKSRAVLPEIEDRVFPREQLFELDQSEPSMERWTA